MAKAVFEEVNGDLAVFIVDNVKNPYHVKVSELPEGSSTGDVFEVKLLEGDTLHLIDKLPTERKKREASSRTKREQLLNRNKQS